MAARGLVSAFWLKLAMLLLMIFDHLYYYIFPQDLLFAHYLARIVAPVFTFLMTQGLVYTRNRIRYILRLFGFGIIMAVGNLILNLVTKINIPNNIFLSLGIGAAVIFCIEQQKSDENRVPWVAFTVILFIASLFCEGQYIVPLMAVIFYFFRENRKLMYSAYIVVSGVPYLIAYALTGELKAQFFMIFAVLPIMLYNGRRGQDTAFAKYFFYIFYPLHVWVIVLAKYFIK